MNFENVDKKIFQEGYRFALIVLRSMGIEPSVLV
jgi:hypothetical protein